MACSLLVPQISQERFVKDKPPIYPYPEPELVLVQANTPLEHRIALARQTTWLKYQDARRHVQGVVDHWIGVENAVERHIKSLIPVDESLTPGALYVGVAALTGSILARNRSFLLRISLPSTLFILSMNHFLPKTSHNISSYLTLLERTHAPALADTHTQLNSKLASTSLAAHQIWQHAQIKTVTSLEYTLSRIQDMTGLKLLEVAGWNQKVMENAEMNRGDIETSGEKGQRDT